MMATLAVLIDWCPSSRPPNSVSTSLLGVPLGASSVAECLRDGLAAREFDGWAVVSNGPGGPDYARVVRCVAPQATVVESSAFAEFLGTMEPTDWLVFVDARHFPHADLDRVLSLQVEGANVAAAHLVHLERTDEGTRERVVCDECHRVRVIQRLYTGVTDVEATGVSCAVMSVAMAQHLQHQDLFHLPRMRTRLVACGVPNLDITAAHAPLDLLHAEDLLALNEGTLVATFRKAVPVSFTARAPDIWVGPHCRIHPTSRIYGPAILHDDVVVDADAVVIGPVVLGPGVRVERRAVISQCLVARRVHIRSGVSVTRRVLLDSADAVALSGETAAHPTTAATFTTDSDVNGLAPPPRLDALLKRVFDVVLGLLGLLALSPLLLIVAALIKLTSRGPVLFGHQREGRGGRVFCCWKFRTMVQGAHTQQRALYGANQVDGPQFKLSNDPRVTRLGRWLRSTNIDEIPQLLNVLRGEMSLIGPRPSPFRENQICVPWRNARLAVRPGITGLWQVCRSDRSAGDFHQWIYMDMLYVRHWSLSLDLRVFLATLLTLGGRWSVPLHWMIPGRTHRTSAPQPMLPAHTHAVIRYRSTNAQEPAQSLTAGARS